MKWFGMNAGGELGFLKGAVFAGSNLGIVFKGGGIATVAPTLYPHLYECSRGGEGGGTL